ncbi:hypothetical protein VP01_4832g3 [Puccinia sorghi]|uniref:Reverse transcriptase Ty1/copia-type domain-containing protein n=1 Tax=Puccinia sorghi TaxID=27349 RepID=A0A0L6UN75_9BASI|nr:hypothetical protein VP01_4832g3 [Puccinia sorghi]
MGPENNFEKEFEKCFSNLSFHNPNTILGMKFKKENHQIKLSLPNHIQHGLEELGLVDCKTSITPPTPNLKLRDATNEDHFRFKKLNINYRMTHWHEVKKVWQYLKGTANLKLTLSIKEPTQLLQIYSNASWGYDPQDRTSQLGYLCSLFGALISWNSSKQRSITNSLTEAKLPLVKSFHEGIWLKALLAELWNIQLAQLIISSMTPNSMKSMTTEEEFKEKFSKNTSSTTKFSTIR